MRGTESSEFQFPWKQTTLMLGWFSCFWLLVHAKYEGACNEKPGDGEIYFIANIPHQIDADWDKRYAHLAGFPLNVM